MQELAIYEVLPKKIFPCDVWFSEVDLFSAKIHFFFISKLESLTIEQRLLFYEIALPLKIPTIILSDVLINKFNAVKIYKHGELYER